jgi:HAD superfamily hydrolase (TIGR01459 family)
MSLPPPTVLADLLDRYDVFFVDQFGVLIDGQQAYPGAVDALQQLKRANKRVLLLSNSGKPGTSSVDRLARMGFAPALFDHVVTSGDTSLALGHSLIKGKGGRGLTISRDGDQSLSQGLGLDSTSNPALADLLLLTGSEADTVSMDDYMRLLQTLAQRNVPCICTNPDQLMLSCAGLVAGAGALADLYEGMGGTVRRVGKPFPEIYQHAWRTVGEPTKSKILCIGDSLDHDGLGAARFGAPFALVRTGVDATLRPAELRNRAVKQNMPITHLLASFA